MCAIIFRVIFVPLTSFKFVGVNCIRDQNIFASSSKDFFHSWLFSEIFGRYFETCTNLAFKQLWKNL